ncbi:MAG TPA: hypothetical protein VMW29_03910 [Candidatus Bathyarchaeia archaeon]|nr:hypothetical protein [Candidatus Bathyarchaeia archaeon]
MSRTRPLRPASFAEIQAAADGQQALGIITRLQGIGVPPDQLGGYVVGVAQGEGTKVLNALTGEWPSLLAKISPATVV